MKKLPPHSALVSKVVKEQAVKENGMRWEHLVSMHNQIGLYMRNVSTIAVFMRNKTLMAEVEDRETLVRLVPALARDLKLIHSRTIAIEQTYPTKVGPILDDEDMMKAIGIYEEYNQIMLDIAGVLMPISDQVMEILTLAERAVAKKEEAILAAQAEAAALADPAAKLALDASRMDAISSTEPDDVIVDFLLPNYLKPAHKK